MIKDKAQYNAYMNTYMKDRYLKRREKAVNHLGGKCAKCGSTCTLQFDHIDPSTKVATIARMSSMSEAKFTLEIDKCKLLCEACHKAKTKAEGSGGDIERQMTCTCGKMFDTIKQYAGHKRWCT